MKKPRLDSGSIQFGFLRLSKKYAFAPGLPRRATAASTCSGVGAFKDDIQSIEVRNCGLRECLQCLLEKSYLLLKFRRVRPAVIGIRCVGATNKVVVHLM